MSTLRAFTSLLSLLTAMVPLAACITIPTSYSKAVAISCVDPAKVPVKPVVRSEGEIKALDDYRVIPALRADRLRLIEHNDKLDAIVQGCLTIPSAAEPQP